MQKFSSIRSSGQSWRIPPPPRVDAWGKWASEWLRGFDRSNTNGRTEGGKRCRSGGGGPTGRPTESSPPLDGRSPKRKDVYCCSVNLMVSRRAAREERNVSILLASQPLLVSTLFSTSSVLCYSSGNWQLASLRSWSQTPMLACCWGAISRYNGRWYNVRFSNTGRRYNMSKIQFDKSRSSHNRCRYNTANQN